MTKQTVYLPAKVEEDKTSILSSLPKEEWGVHRTHCCKKHGCKYGYEDCPVFLGHVEQDYRCESNNFDDCFEPNFDLDKQEGYFFTPEELNAYTQSVIKQALETAAEKAYALVKDHDLYIRDYVGTEYSVDIDMSEDSPLQYGCSVITDKESITNTFEETYNKLKV